MLALLTHKTVLSGNARRTHRFYGVVLLSVVNGKNASLFGLIENDPRPIDGDVDYMQRD